MISDILTTHPSLLSSQSGDVAIQKSVSKIFHKALKAVYETDVQSAAIIALCKLMLTGVIQDEDLLKQIVICFFDPATKGNAVVRQALSYFLPVYCHSRRENMEKMAVVVPGVIHSLMGLIEELDEDEEMVGIGVVGSMLLDWTDARKLVVQDEDGIGWDESGKREAKAINGDIHLDLAVELLEKVMSHGCTSKLHEITPFFATIQYQLLKFRFLGEEKKAIIPLLGKLYISPNSSSEKLQTAHELVVEAIDLKVANDAPSRNAFTKLLNALVKVIGEAKMSIKAMEVDEGNTTTLDAADEGSSTVHRITEERTEIQDSLVSELLEDESMGE